MGFVPCIAEPDTWMRKNGNIWEYIGVYVDDLTFAMKNPQGFVDVLEKKYGFKLKGTGPISFHLGCDFFRDSDGVLCMAPMKYIEKVIANYSKLFNDEKLQKRVKSPIEPGDHPELDNSNLLDVEGIQKYQSIIGSLQWAISLGRFDIATAVMMLKECAW